MDGSDLHWVEPGGEMAVLNPLSMGDLEAKLAQSQLGALPEEDVVGVLDRDGIQVDALVW